LRRQRNQSASPPRFARLARMTVPELRTRHEKTVCAEAKSHHREFLARQIAWRLQAEAEGGVPEEIRQLALAVARDAPLRVRIECAAARVFRRRTAPQLPDWPATTTAACRCRGGLLAKEHKGETHVVKVLDNGFDYDGRLYRSLSAIAQEITGTKWNGYLFFGIAKEVAHGRR